MPADITIHTIQYQSLSKIKVKQTGYRPGVAQRIPGSEGSQIT